MKPLKWYFNTSHVSINQIKELDISTPPKHFNTSHVSINRISKAFNVMVAGNFNTSHVSINPAAVQEPTKP